MTKWNTSTPTVYDMVESALRAGGYDGLFFLPCECACGVDDLAPCNDIQAGCRAGYRVPCDGTCECGKCDFHIVKTKEDGEEGGWR